MTAGIQDLTIDAGASFRLSAVYRQPTSDPAVPGALYDLTGYTAKMQIRLKANTPDPPLVDLSTENGGIALGAATGTVTVFITREQTATLQNIRTAAYDLFLIPPGDLLEAIRMIAGRVQITPAVTVFV